MAGHSKWSNIKNKKGKTDAARGHIFTKIGREIAVAVKQGGADPASNSRLRDVIVKAKQNNMPNDNINRSIKKASGELDSVNYEEITYEGYAAGGVALIIETLTDNRNRTAGEVRHLLDKYGGSLGQ
ncbi:MAG: YebC/PmpR family DNA-binding transcriptional regulator, partial [Clostridia bacterium]